MAGLPAQVGLIVNPVAGLGGPGALHGSDARDIRDLAAGVTPGATARAALALSVLAERRPDLELLTVAGDMGADAAALAGLPATVLVDRPVLTTAADTRRAAATLLANGVSLLLFVGGDGTARDLLWGGPRAALGVPAGVKVHSAVYAVSPRAAGEVAAAYLAGTASLRPGEVVDRPDPAHVSARLYGCLSVPHLPDRVQTRKLGSSAPAGTGVPPVEVDPAVLTVFGPGTTTGAVLGRLGVAAPVTGVTALLHGQVYPDADAATLERLATVRVHVVVSPIGGQGFLLGRGNQQLTPALLRVAELTIVATEAKLAALGGRPLLVDTGDEALDAALRGYHPVRTSATASTMYKIT